MVVLVRSIRIFLSSPGDLAPERKLVSEICKKLEQDLGNIGKFAINLIQWETHTFSARGKSAQDIINSQIGDDYDIFLGMMGSRFGTPTGSYGSGTEEEFSRALDQNKIDSKPQIMFFFCERRVVANRVDTKQTSKIQKFRKRLGAEGVLYFDVGEEISLWSTLYSQLWKTIQVVLKSSDVGPDEDISAAEANLFDPLLEWNALNHADSEVNASVLIQAGAYAIGRVNAEVISITKANSSMLRSFARETPVIQPPFALANAPKVLKSINAVTTEIKNTCRQYLEVIPRLNIHLRESVEFTLRSITIFIQRGEMTKELSQVFFDKIAEFRSTLDTLCDTLASMDEKLSIDHAPGTGFSVEQRKFAALTRDLRRVIQNGALEMRRLEAANPFATSQN